MAEETQSKYTREISSDFVTFDDEGKLDEREKPCVQQLAGLLVSSTKIQMQNGLVGKYQIENTETQAKTSFLGGAILDDKLGELEIGTDVQITFDGRDKAKPGKSGMKQFTVLVAD